MSIVNFATVVETKLAIELEAYRSGDIEWGVSTQFNETILESAIENVSGKSIESLYEFYGEHKVHVMDYARFLSDFEEPEISNAWID